MTPALGRSAISSAELGRSARGVDERPDPSTWQDVSVPMGVHRALVAAGLLEDPDRTADDDACAWVLDEDWWWRLRLPADPVPLRPDERRLLVCSGLDGSLSCYVDGVLSATHDSSFRPFVLELPRSTADVVVVDLRFHALGADADREQVLLTQRRPAFGTGWDFAPRRPSIGPSRPVEVVRQRIAALSSVTFRTVQLDPERAHVVVHCEVDRFAEGSVEVRTTLTTPDGEVHRATGAAVTFDLPRPRTWWTHDRGEPALHDLVVELWAGDALLDRTSRRVGVRTTAVDRSDGRFRLLLNGEPVAAHGANWVPCSTDQGSVPAARYERLVDDAIAAHMNVLRVWGGGTYEADAFYDACDARGVLVWQDFMLAGAPYRDEPAFLAEVADEADVQVRRLQTHPCIGVWCGNNEVELLAGLLRWPDPDPGHRLFHEVLPTTLAAVDPGAPYLPTSPLQGGDAHVWEVWHGISTADDDADRASAAWAQDERVLAPGSRAAEEFVRRAGAHRYLESVPAFASEFGLAAPPTLATLAAWTDEADLRLGSASVEGRFRAGRLGPRNKPALLVGAEVGVATDLREHVLFGQLLQAEGLKTGIEHYRRHWPRCAGALVWQLDDCWPSTSWALIDVDLRRKAGYSAVRRAFAPVLASFAPVTGSVDLWVTNTSTSAVDDELVVELRSLAGAVVRRWTTPARVAAGSSACVLEGLPSPAADGYLRVHSTSPTIAVNRHFGCPIRDLERARPQVRWHVEADDERLRISVTSDGYALLVHATHPTVALRLDDDHVDLQAGETRVLTAPRDGLDDVTGIRVDWL